MSTVEIRQRVQAYGVEADRPLLEIAADLAERAIDVGDLYRKVLREAARDGGYDLDTVLADVANVRAVWEPQRMGDAVTGAD